MVPELAKIDSLLMFLAGCALLTMILLRRSYRYFGQPRRRGGSGPAIEKQHRPMTEWDGAHRDADARIERQKVELHEFARDAAGRINSKMLMLEQLIQTSDRQIKRLETLLSELEHKQPSTCAGAAKEGGKRRHSMGR